MHLAIAALNAEPAPIQFMDLQLGNRIDAIDRIDQVVDLMLAPSPGTVLAHNHEIRACRRRPSPR